MRFAWITLKKDLRQRVRDPFSVLLWAGIPFGILVIFSLAFGGSGDVKPQARVLVVDEDGNLLSGLLTGAMDQGELAELIDLEPVTREEGERRIAAGDGSALLIIPEGFSDAVLRNEPTTLKLLTNPSQRILPGIVEGVLQVIVDATFYLQQIMSEPLGEIRESTQDFSVAPANSLVSSVSVQLNDTVRNLEGYLFPPAIELVIEMEQVEEEESPAISFGGLFFQSMLFMFLLFGSQAISDELWREREERTLRRVLTTAGSVTAFLLGKVLAGIALLGSILTAALLAGTWLYDLPWATFPLALCWMVLVAALLIAMFSLVQMFATSRRGASLIANVIVFPIMMVGGSFFPPEGLPDWIAAVGRFTPNGYGIAVLKELQSGSPDVSCVLFSIALFGALTAAGLWLTAFKLRRGFAKAAA